MENWDNIRFFIAVARSNTVSAAAAGLGVTHATVLRRIGNFEQELGLKLFHRLQSGYQLTEMGELLLQRALKVEEQTAALTREVEGRDQQLAGRIRVSQPENDVLDLYPLYAKFIKQYPEIQLEIAASHYEASLARREADVAIRFTNTPTETLVGRCIGKVTFGAYCNKQYFRRLKGREFKNPKDLADIDWVIWRGGSGVVGGDLQCEWLQEKVAAPKIVLQASSVSDVISAARAGIGVGLVSHIVAHHYRDLMPLPRTEIVGHMDVWVLAHQDLRKLPRVQHFMRFMADGLKDLLRTTG